MTVYTYDGVGNRLTMNNINYTYDACDRLFQAGDVTYQWNNNGNMISKNETGVITTYTYDYANRLIGVDNPSIVVNYTYDGYGRRTSRLVKAKGLGIPEAQYTEYLWDGTNVLSEFYQNKYNPLCYVHGINEQLISRDDLLWLKKADKVEVQNSHWFYCDVLGSIINITDANGNIKLSYDYDVFGEITEEGSVGWKRNVYSFTGKPYDPASGIYYFGARWYEAEVGRFVTKDLYTFTPEDPRIIPYHGNLVINLITAKSKNLIPIPTNPTIKVLFQWQMNPKYSHRYTYVMNNPMRYIDMYGLCPKTPEDWGLYGGIYWGEWGIKIGFLGLSLGVKDTKIYFSSQFLLLGIEAGFNWWDLKFYSDISMGIEFQLGPLYGGWDIIKFTETLWSPEIMERFLELGGE